MQDAAQLMQDAAQLMQDAAHSRKYSERLIQGLALYWKGVEKYNHNEDKINFGMDNRIIVVPKLCSLASLNGMLV